MTHAARSKRGRSKKRKHIGKRRDICNDCGVDTASFPDGKSEYYMVHDGLWSQAGMEDGDLCIGCLETRLGRKLAPTDFKDVTVNIPNPWDTPRLASRKKHQSAHV
jgi:hypothetical protein